MDIEHANYFPSIEAFVIFKFITVCLPTTIIGVGPHATIISQLAHSFNPPSMRSLLILVIALCSFLMFSSAYLRSPPKALLRMRGGLRSLAVRGGARPASTTADPTLADKKKSAKQGPMPITVLSGFLGVGKTTFLNHLLTNNAGLKVGLVVNDVASVNVDAKQIRSLSLAKNDGTGSDIDTMELQNGCVCCSLAEDMLASISKLVSLSELKGERYDHIIVECSGVAEPRNIRDVFQQAQDYKMEIMKKLRLDTLITLVDVQTFYKLFGTDHTLQQHRELAFGNTAGGSKDDNNVNTAFLASSTSIVDENTVNGTPADGSENDENTAMRKVTDLLLEQVECADIVIINKCDLASSPAEIEVVRRVVSSINPLASVLTCTRGQLADPLKLIGSQGGQGAANWALLDEHRNLVKCAEKEMEEKQKEEEEKKKREAVEKAAHEHHCHDAHCTHPSHTHDHAHAHAHEHSHDHSHSHSHSHEHSNTHDHGHSHEHKDICHDNHCTDPSHSHEHSHSHDHAATCSDAHCTDPTHDHSHSHAHSHTTTAQERFGITSFVYRRRTPFHPLRFSALLQSLGRLSIDGIDSLSLPTKPEHSLGEQDKETLDAARRALLRSKGFIWLATSQAAAYFLSHAGQYLEMSIMGRWWADIDRQQWPDGMETEIESDFAGEHGDRRQELVFIGQFGENDGKSREALEDALDSCLLTEEEMRDYVRVAKKGGDLALQDHFVPDWPK